MKKLIYFVLLLAASAISAQHTIYGTFSPAEDYQWLIAYQLKPGTQNYVAETRIQDGKFSLKLPENSSSGIYRLVYAVPQEEFYFDVLVNDEENIELSFTTRAGVSFSSSKENRLFNSYFEEINKVKQKIIGFYTSQNTDRNKFKGLVKQLKMIQNSYEEKTKGMMAENFVKANRPYLPADFEPVQDYINNKKQNYFNHLDFSNSVLQASDFLTDKIINYVFTALPLAHASPTELEKSVKKNVDAVVTRLPDVSNAYKVKLYYDLWKQATASSLTETSDYLYSYLKPLATNTGNQRIIDEIEIHDRLRLGAPAPEIVWKSENSLKKLSELDDSFNYLLVFWSSSCSHCLHELPKLHEQLNDRIKLKVIAIGLEEDEIT